MSFLSQIATATVPVQPQQRSARVKKTPEQLSFEAFLAKHPNYLGLQFAQVKKLCCRWKCNKMVLETYQAHKKRCAEQRMQFVRDREAARRAKLTPEQREAEDAQRKADAEASRIRTGALPEGAMDIVMQSSYYNGLCNSVSPGSA
jgi:hypothetical protein